MEMWGTFLSPDNDSSEPNNISAFADKCPPHYQKYITVWSVSKLLNAVVTFPGSVAVLWQIIHRHRPSTHRGQSWSSHLSVSPDLLIINLGLVTINACIEQVISAINSLQVGSALPTHVIKALMAITLTAGPPTMTAICVDCYLAVVHPLKYTTLRTTWKHPLLLTMLVWFYAITTNTIIIVCQLPSYNFFCLFTFYVALPAVTFLNISTLQALWRASPGRHSLADLGPIKRRVFWVVLCILLSSFMYCLPQVVLLTCWAVLNVRQAYFLCVVYPMVMLLPNTMIAVISLLFVYIMIRS